MERSRWLVALPGLMACLSCGQSSSEPAASADAGLAACPEPRSSDDLSAFAPVRGSVSVSRHLNWDSESPYKTLVFVNAELWLDGPPPPQAAHPDIVLAQKNCVYYRRPGNQHVMTIEACR